MKNIMLIINKNAGSNQLEWYLKSFTYELLEHDVNIHASVFVSLNEMENYFMTLKKGTYDAIFIVGGDGTVNTVVNLMMKYKKMHPVGILPTGTANDFAHYLQLDIHPAEIAKLYITESTQSIDLGKVNDKYFVNVCCAGCFTSGTIKFSEKEKKKYGKLAYYIAGAKQLSEFKPDLVRITADGIVYEEKLYLFLAFNGVSAGGFKKIALNAAADDGLIDFIGIKSPEMIEMPGLLMKIINGSHFDDPNILYLRTNRIRIENTTDNSIYKISDIDGNIGPEFPLDVSLERNKLIVYA